MNPITLLDDHLINKIAAGEVIERPSSVVKELTENAIDAHSRNINVLITEGGLNSIEVEDDGDGIAFAEMETAFLRHATSKITDEADLFQLHSLGFRGEALPSIASISRIELYSAAEGQLGKKVYLEAGQFQESVPIPYPRGSKFIVRDLFFNTPVRKKFCKSPASEFQKVYDTLQRLALSRTDISFRFQHNQRFYFQTPGNGKLTDTIVSLWGRDFIDYLLPISYQGELIKLSGLISRPDYKRNDRKRQYFYINGRSIQSPMLSRAVEEAFRGLLVSKEFPVVFLYIELPPGQVDCNVHPQKLQVRFRDDSLLFKTVCDGLRVKLRELFHKVELGSLSHPEISEPAYTPSPGRLKFHPPAYTKTPEPAKVFSLPQAIFTEEAERSYKESLPPLTVDQNFLTDSIAESEPNQSSVQILGQIFATYLLVMWEGKFWIIDQHAAHERIHYNRILRELSQNTPKSQLLLMPQTVEVTPWLLETWEKYQDAIRSAGFEVEAFGETALIIRAMPEFLELEDFSLPELIETFAASSIEQVWHEMAAGYACKKSIKAGEILSAEEMRQLVSNLFAADDFKHCPHGRPTLLELSKSELEKFFKRIK